MTRLLAPLFLLGCASATTPLLTVVPTPEGPVSVYADAPLTAEQRAAISSEVEEGYRDGRSFYGEHLPPTSSFIVRVLPRLADHGYYRGGVIACEAHGDNGFCDALDDELSLRHFCHVLGGLDC